MPRSGPRPRQETATQTHASDQAEKAAPDGPKADSGLLPDQIPRDVSSHKRQQSLIFHELQGVNILKLNPKKMSRVGTTL
jgi:hypothetical protein